MNVRLLLMVLMSLLMLNSCNYFKKHRLFSRNVDTILDMTIEQPEPVAVDSTALVAEEPVLPEEAAVPSYQPGSGKYFMIVGSFQNENLARRYAEKIKNMGYDAQIIEASNGFFRVSAKTYANFQQGVNDIAAFRSSVTEGAWLHVRN